MAIDTINTIGVILIESAFARRKQREKVTKTEE